MKHEVQSDKNLHELKHENLCQDAVSDQVHPEGGILVLPSLMMSPCWFFGAPKPRHGYA